MHMYKVEKGMIQFFHSLVSQNKKKMLCITVSALNYQFLLVLLYNIVLVIYSTMLLFISKNFFNFFLHPKLTNSLKKKKELPLILIQL